jgi:molecular chaperone GrpE
MEKDESPEGDTFEELTSQQIEKPERETLLRGFSAWLDSALASEELPQGLTAELFSALANGEPLPPLDSAVPGGGCDLYSLWAAMIALTQEIRLQGRAFKQLNETLLRSAKPAEDSTVEQQAAEESRSGGAKVSPASSRQPRKQEIDVLLDLRDRVERSGATARNAAQELAPSRLPRLARWLGVGNGYARHAQEIVAALSGGLSLTVDTLDEALLACRISRIECQGRLFDPTRMTAVDIEQTSAVPEGTVVEVYRNGYEWNGEVYRTAKVKVVRNNLERNVE